MGYGPFERGRWPVGVVSLELGDAGRAGRRLPLEVWYPAAAGHRGEDVEAATQDRFQVVADGPLLPQAAVREAAPAVPAAGGWPLVVFSHTSNGHRRQSSFLCTHLASHGYVVAAVDHVGNTAVEAAERATRGPTWSAAERDAYIAQIIADRVPDLRCVLDHILAGAVATVAGQVDGQRIGVVGWSFGGWAALALPEADGRVGAVVALVPGGSARPLPGIIPATLTFDWLRPAPTLLLAAADDQYTPLDGQQELFERTRAPKRLFVLEHAGHGHFGDQIEEPGACPPEAAHAFTRGLTLAHLDATLKGDAGAAHFLDTAALTALAARGVAAHAGLDCGGEPQDRLVQ